MSSLTPQVDVYAFAISCVELLTKGSVPWFMANDEAVRHFVLGTWSSEDICPQSDETRQTDLDKRPDLPLLRDWSLPLQGILETCWDKSPGARPTFERLDESLDQLRRAFGWNGIEHVQMGEDVREQDWIDWIDGLNKDARSPALTVVPLPNLPRKQLSRIRILHI